MKTYIRVNQHKNSTPKHKWNHHRIHCLEVSCNERVARVIYYMASRFTIYSNKPISYIVYKISSLINKISTLFYYISIIKKISYIANKISVLLY